MKIIYNLHTHNHFCKHAVGTVSDYCEIANRSGLKIVGISDHTPFPDDRWTDVRMNFEQLDPYFEEIETARSIYPDLTILKAFECEYVAEFKSFFEDEYLGRLDCDYLIGGMHYVFFNGQWLSTFHTEYNNAFLTAYTDYLIESMKSGPFLFMAHPDLFSLGYHDWNDHAKSCARAILEAAQELHMPLEINGNGFRKSIYKTSDNRLVRGYPKDEFWEMASDYEIEVLVNSDAHHPDDMIANIDDGINLANTYNLRLYDVNKLVNKVINNQ